MPYVKKFASHGFFEKYDLPCTINFNFTKLFEYWEALAESDIPEIAGYAKNSLKKLNKAEALKKPFDDPSILEKYEKELRLLLSPIFSPLTTKNEIKAVCMPFKPILFNMTERFENILKAAGGDDENFKMRVLDFDMMYISSCVIMLNVNYSAHLNFTESLFMDFKDQKTGLMRHYRVLINADFSSFKVSDGFKPPSEEDIQLLKDNFDNIELWKEKIPPNSFELEGFAIMTLVDTTNEEAVLSLKFNLLKKDALQSPEVLELIRFQLCSLLGIPNLKLGFTVFDKDRNRLRSLAYGFWNSLILDDKSVCPTKECFCDRSYPHIFKDKKALAVSHFNDNTYSNPLVDKLRKLKLKSYIALPLLFDNEIIGLLELGSENVKELNAVAAKKLDLVAPLFATALKRSVDELEIQLEAIIREKCTAIHSSVNWRFMEAAETLYYQNRLDGTTEMEEISFPEVYPLFGQSDIKGSSTARNESIQADMIRQLTLAKNVFKLAIKNNPLPIYQDFCFRINATIKRLKKGLGAGDEISILDFLKRQIYPVFRHLEKQNRELKDSVQNYIDSLDKKLGVVYDKRKDYEESVSAINNKISEYLDLAQEEAQEMFPHYFEKYKTDGVEHNIYIGQSMVDSREFDPVYLANLRLWQLMMTCEVENEVARLKPTLKVPLDICSLILIHSNPITIRFGQEDKRFDVDGAYNVRYEIIKKRIDKAFVNNETERLTQPGKIAIVYSQDSEAREYLNFLQYLQSINYIGPNIEWLELQELQGVSGLKALRVDVVYHKAEPIKRKSKVALMHGNGEG